MRQASKRVLTALLLAACCAASLGAQPEDPTVDALRARLDLLFESVLDENAAGIDEVTCLDDLLGAQLRREEALGLISSADDPTLVDERKAAVRAAVDRFVLRLFVEGQEIESIDASRVELAAEEGERLLGEDGDALEITASGAVGVQMAGLTRPVDFGVYRLADRWCLDPLSMQ